MNLPNITLFFQILHFIVAYIILRRFVFQPALMIILKNEETENFLKNKVIVANSEQKTLEQKQKQRWRFIQLSLSDMVPNLQEIYCVSAVKKTDNQTQSMVLSQEEKESVKKILHDELLDVI